MQKGVVLSTIQIQIRIQRQIEIQFKNTTNAKDRWASLCPAISITLVAFWPSVDNIDDDDEFCFS